MPHRSRRTPLRVEALEDRSLPSIMLQFDYSLDKNNFFNTALKRNLLEQAGKLITQEFGDTLSAITPSGGNTWTPWVYDPATGAQHNLPNLSVSADTIIIYAGGRNLAGPELGVGGGGGYSDRGSQAWLDTVKGRGQAGALKAAPTDYAPAVGSVTFSTNFANWFFGETTAGLTSNQSDFLSVATHELGHALGIGTAPSWQTYVSAGKFVGPAAAATFGGPVPLNPGRDHWAQGTRSGGSETVMDPVITNGTRKLLTPLDFAGLRDVGWQVASLTAPRVVWNPWVKYNGTIASQITTGHEANGRQVLFHIGTGHDVLYSEQSTPGGAWTNWVSLGGNVKQIAVGNNADGRMELFALNADNTVSHRWQTSPNGPWVGNWASFAGNAKQLALGHFANGQLDLFTIAGDNAVWHVTQFGTAWTPWTKLGGSVKQIALGYNQDGREEVFAIGTDNAVWHLLQKSTNVNSFSAISSLGGYAKQLTVGQNADGREEIFYVGKDDMVWHRWQTSPNSSSWSNSVSFGDVPAGQLTVASNPDGRLDLFTIGIDGAINEIWQNAPNGGWSGWFHMNGTFARQLAIGRFSDGRLQLYHIGSDWAIYYRWQMYP